MKLKLIKVLVVLIALLLIFLNLSILGVPFFKAGITNNGEEVALAFLKEESMLDPKLINATVDFPCSYTDKSLHERFLVYAIKKDASVIGRIVLLKTKNNYTVLEMAETPPPHINYITEISKHISLNEEETVGQPNFIYVFPLLYYIHFNIIKEGKQVRDVYFFWNEKRVADLNEIPEEKIELTNADLIKEQGTTSMKVLRDVPEYITNTYPGLCNSCGPVAGANILGYWSRHGYPNLWNESSDPKGRELATSLYYYYMGTTPVGTFLIDFPSGIESYSRDYGYVFSTYIDPEAQVYGSFVREINNGRPLGIRIQLGGLLDQHWITGIGYYYGYSGYYVYVRDGWNNGYAMINWDDPFLGTSPITSFIDNVYVYPVG